MYLDTNYIHIRIFSSTQELNFREGKSIPNENGYTSSTFVRTIMSAGSLKARENNSTRAIQPSFSFTQVVDVITRAENFQVN